ncbi:MAG: DUF1194 domain-containing protein [Rhizobiaceae bacterium]
MSGRGLASDKCRSLIMGAMLASMMASAHANEIIIPFALAPPNPAESAPVETKPLDLMLCLAADVSESVTAMEYDLQKRGHAAAIEDETVVNLIRDGIHGRIGVVYIEWADQNQQHLAADWHVIEDQQSAAKFADAIRTSPQPPWINWNVRNTSTSEVVRYCMRQFERHTGQHSRRVIDISSDGTNNVGHRIDGIRDLAVSQGVTINVLAIEDSLSPFPDGTHTRPDGGLVRYFKNNVAGGAGAFVHAASGYASFGEMIKRKFLLELASLN